LVKKLNFCCLPYCFILLWWFVFYGAVFLKCVGKRSLIEENIFCTDLKDLTDLTIARKNQERNFASLRLCNKILLINR
jgi:hypothetical protein